MTPVSWPSCTSSPAHGSWMTRGHKSLYGIGYVVNVYAGRRLGGKAKSAFQRWFVDHREECQQNYSSLSGGMEQAAAELLWRRSVDRGFHYMTLLSDGDAYTFKHLTDLKVYRDVVLEKEECIDHVSKRLGTVLRNLASSGKKAGVTLGGRGHGKLTEAAITKLTAYYGKAVRAHSGDLAGMRDAVLASFYHAISTDNDRCPQGDDSWCFFQRAYAEDEECAASRPRRHAATLPLWRYTERQREPACQDVAEVPKDRLCWAAAGRGRQTRRSADAAFNVGVKATMQHLCDAMGVETGRQLLDSASKAATSSRPQGAAPGGRGDEGGATRPQAAVLCPLL